MSIQRNGETDVLHCCFAIASVRSGLSFSNFLLMSGGCRCIDLHAFRRSGSRPVSGWVADQTRHVLFPSHKRFEDELGISGCFSKAMSKAFPRVFIGFS